MEELIVNGLVATQEAAHPLQTERFIAKFKGKSPIGSKGPNFLNRTKQSTKPRKTSDEPALKGNPKSQIEDGSRSGSPGYNKAFNIVPIKSPVGFKHEITQQQTKTERLLDQSVLND